MPKNKKRPHGHYCKIYQPDDEFPYAAAFGGREEMAESQN